MSRLDELIQEYCPNGVEYVPLGSVVKFLNGRAFKQTELHEDGKYKVLRVGNFHTNEKWYYSDLELDDNKYCINGDLLYTWAATFGPEIWHGEKTIFHYHIWKLEFDEKHINKKYLYHFLQMDIDNISKSLTNSTMPHVSMSSMNKRIVPIPPIPVQEEIVRILDTFTELTAELQAELQARKKQYEYYRDFLIDNIEGFRGKLIDVLSQPITDGPHITPKLYESGVPFVSATAVYDGKVHLSDMKGYISKEFDKECAKKYKPQRNDVFMVKSGSTTGKVAFVDFDDDFNVWSPIAAMRVSNSNSPRFLYHLLQTRNIQTQVKEKMSQGSQPNLSMRALESFDVIIPPLEKQKEIVDFLDKIDEICNDANSGILAEIEARQKQYEYYRDKLLNFKPLS